MNFPPNILAHLLDSFLPKSFLPQTHMCVGLIQLRQHGVDLLDLKTILMQRYQRSDAEVSTLLRQIQSTH